MSKRAIAVLGIAAAITAAGGACTIDSSPLAPRGPGLDTGAVAAAGAGSLAGLQPVQALQRSRALDRDLRWSFIVGPRGGTAHDRATGLTMTFAHGAVPAPVRITVIALAGSDIAYRFEPHGLRFAAPVMLRQSLHDARPWSADTARFPLAGAYFTGDRPQTDAATGGILASEILPATVERSGIVRFRIYHFSGYTVASAVRDSSQDEGGR